MRESFLSWQSFLWLRLRSLKIQKNLPDVGGKSNEIYSEFILDGARLLNIENCAVHSDKQHRIIKLQVTSNVPHEHTNLVTVKQLRNRQQLAGSNLQKLAKKKASKISSLDYKGMTLKEYFRMSEAGPTPEIEEIKETQQQNACNSKQATTPYFNQGHGRQKIKTQTYQDKSFVQDKPSFLQKEKNKQIFPFDNKTKQLKIERIPVQIHTKKEPKGNRNRRAITLGSHQKEQLNRSTITSFYNIEDKQKKMLEKVKHEKQRINQMKLSDAFFITKYAFKFHINPHDAF